MTLLRKAKVKKEQIGVVLMTYGSPTTLDDIPVYLKHVYGGREANQKVIAEFQRRYDLIGGSPLLRITHEQATALEKELIAQHPNGPSYQVVVGMRFAPPFIADAIPVLANTANKLVGVIMSPQYSSIIMSGYVNALEESVENFKRNDLEVYITKSWNLEPYFLQALAERVQQALDRFPPEISARVPVLFTAHSMPRRVSKNEPNYINALKETASLVAKLVSLSKKRWMFCYQSAGHTREEWLKPDFADIMPKLQAAGHTHVLIVPIQFLADHLEILYDIDIGARNQTEACGIRFARIESLNTSPLFIKALAKVVKKTISNPNNKLTS